jgi:hypothetical protein
MVNFTGTPNEDPQSFEVYFISIHQVLIGEDNVDTGGKLCQ